MGTEGCPRLATRLVGVSQTTHTAHDTENVVIDSIDIDGLGRSRQVSLSQSSETSKTSLDGDLERGVINAREVARARRLVVLGLQGERIHVDTRRGRNAGVGLLGLHKVEVRAITSVEAILAVELQLASNDGVLETIIGVGARDSQAVEGQGRHMALAGKGVSISDSRRGRRDSRGVSRNNRRRHDGGEVRPLRVTSNDVGVVTDSPDELLDGVVEVELDGGGRIGGVTSDRLHTSELELLNQVLVRDLGEAATLISVKVDVINPEGDVAEARARVGRAQSLSADGTSGGLVDPQVGQSLELDVDLDFVVLKGNQGERQTDVAAEPELERHVDLATLDGSGSGGSTSSLETSRLTISINGVLTNHGEVTRALRGIDGQLRPDLEPVRVLTINELTTNLDLNLLEQVVANIVGPAEHGRGSGGAEGKVRKGSLKVHSVDKITVARDERRDTVAEVSGTVEGLLDRFNREVGMATVDHLEVGDHGVASKVDVLSTISHELHKSASHLYISSRIFFLVRNELIP